MLEEKMSTNVQEIILPWHRCHGSCGEIIEKGVMTPKPTAGLYEAQY